jgi:hypothetical protein
VGPGARSLEEVLAAEGPLGVMPAAGWLARLGKTLDDLHRRGEVHGALSSQAVVVAEISPLAAGELLPAGRLPRAQPPAYRSPERGADGPPSPADDRWAWAVLLAELLLGAVPDGPLVGRRGGEVVPQEGQDALSDFVTTCWAVDPAARPSSAAVLATAMERLLDVAAPLPPLTFAALAGGTGGATSSPGERATKPTFGGGFAALGGLLLLGGLAAAAFVGLSRRGEGRASALTESDADAPIASNDPVRALVGASAAPSFSSIPADAPELVGQGTSTVEACVARVVGAPIEGAFDGVCAQRDALLALGVLREQVRGTDAQKRWDSLGWYDLAAVVSVQGRCCPLTPPTLLDTPASCGVVEALQELQDVAKLRRLAAAKHPLPGQPSAREEAAKTRFGAAATCALHGYSDAKKAHRAAVTPTEARLFSEFFDNL